MNALIVYYSRFGNTRLVAEAIADQIGLEGSVRALSLDRLSAPDLEGLDLMVMGTPTHRMNLPEDVAPLLDALPRKALRRVPVAAFDTSYRMSAFLARFTAAKRLARKLRRLGGVLLLSPETFHVEGREGPLYAGELERAKAWAGQILSRFRARQGKRRKQKNQTS